MSAIRIPGLLAGCATFVVLVGSISCTERTKKEDAVEPEPASAPYKSAEVKLLDALGEHAAGKTVTINSPEEIGRLLSYLRTFGTGETSYTARKWEGSVKIRLTRVDGSEAAVVSNYKWWSETTGDHAVEPGFKEYIESLFE